MKKVLNLIIALTLMLGAFAAQPAQAATASPAAEQASASPKDFITEDGTLKSDIDFRGALDLEGWNVTLDPEHGPVFSQAVGDWGAMGGGGGAFKQSIRSIVVDGADIYVGGAFENAGDNPEADYIAKWNGNEWQALGSNGAGDGALNSSVFTMLFIGSHLYTAGGFWLVKDTNNADIPNSAYLAVWDGSAWSAAPGVSVANPNLCCIDSMVYEPLSDYLYIGGWFENFNDIPEADKVARLHVPTSAWSSLGDNGAGEGSLNKDVYAMAVDSLGNVYIGGDFTDVNRGGIPIPQADNIVRWDGSDWYALGDNGSGDGALNEDVYAIAVDANDHVYAGGFFTGAAGIPEADYIAKWDGAAWSALGDNGGALNFSVVALAADGDDVYIGGIFTNAGGIAEADYIAKWDGAAWSALGDNGGGDGALNSTVYALAFGNNTLYAGGNFYNISNMPAADYFGIWDGNNWSAFGAANGSVNSDIYAIAVNGSDVYVGGRFANLGGDPRIDYLARWDGTNWHPVGNLTQTNGAFNNWVYALAVSGSDLYIGGSFSSVRNEGVLVPEASRIVRWDGSTFHSLNDNGSGGASLNGEVRVITVQGTDVYVGGSFTNINNGGTVIPEADYIARWDGANWHALGSNGSGNGALNSPINAIAVRNNEIYAGGEFGPVKDTANLDIPNSRRLARWDGSTWSAMPGISTQLNDSVHALALSNNRLYVGGDFTDANGITGADRIVMVDLNSGVWSLVGGSGAFNASIRTILTSGDDVFVSGFFTDAAGIPTADYIAKWNGTNWSALGSNGAGDGSLNKEVRALAKSATTLYAVGSFENVNNNGVVIPTADFIATYNLGNNVSTFKSAATPDGWVLESDENSNTGGTLNKGGKTLLLGDDAANKQYRAILSFNTASLPDNAVITKVTLRVKRQGVTGGGNPVAAFGGFMVDIKKGNFGTSALQITDFQTKGNKTLGAFKPTLSGGWYALNLTGGKAQVNKIGNTQIRLRFKTDDNNDFIANFLSLHSGNAASASKPQLVVEFYTP